MKFPFSYSFRNLWTRRFTTVLTAGGMALVVFVFAAVLMLAEGLRKTLVETGSPDNVDRHPGLRRSEVQSGVERLQAAIVESQPEVATGGGRQALLPRNWWCSINLNKRGTDKPANVVIRGIGAQSLALRPQVRLVRGGCPDRGHRKSLPVRALPGVSRAAGWRDAPLRMRDWTVVGIFDAGNTGFDSEIWGDVDQFMQAFRRPIYSSVIFRLGHHQLCRSAKALREPIRG